jgi:nitrite reductase/ring-hydroxylating ferredoxin subunit
VSSPCVCPRREFVAQLAALGAAALVTGCAASDGSGPAGETNTPPTAPPPAGGEAGVRVAGNVLELTIALIPALAANNGSFTHGASQTFVIRRSAAEYRAYSNVCPHQSCGVSGFDGRAMICPCHGSEFDPATGARTAGPADVGTALRARPTTLDGAAGIVRVQLA